MEEHNEEEEKIRNEPDMLAKKLKQWKKNKPKPDPEELSKKMKVTNPSENLKKGISGGLPFSRNVDDMKSIIEKQIAAIDKELERRQKEKNEEEARMKFLEDTMEY